MPVHKRPIGGNVIEVVNVHNEEMAKGALAQFVNFGTPTQGGAVAQLIKEADDRAKKFVQE